MSLKRLCKLSLGLMVLALTACSGGSKTNKGVLSLDYLAVQIEKGENWSIMDADGKVVVKEEYASEDKISLVYSNGVYWVKSNVDQKYRLFSVDSPKIPLTEEEYEEVTGFSDGLAFVSNVTTPIQMINSKGQIVKILPDDILGIRSFSNGMASFQNKNEKYGYIDADGKIAIKAQFSKVFDFSENLAIVQENGGGDYLIIDKGGSKKGTIDADKYEIEEYSFSEGKLAVQDKQTNKLLYLNEKGNVELKLTKDYEFSQQGFVSGYAILTNKNDEWTVIDDKGENVIRPGKYSWIHNVGDGFFIALKNEKFGVIDSEDNTVIDFDYSQMSPGLLGNNYLCRESSFFLINRKGEELKNTEFENLSEMILSNVSFVDVQSISQAFVADIEPQGYKPISGKKIVKDIAKVYKKDSQKQSRYTKGLDVDGFKADLSDVTVRLDFNTYIVKEKTHKEVVDDGWFASEKTVSDGWDWNDEAELQCVVLKMKLSDKVDFNTMADAVGKQLEKNGFKFVGNISSERIYEAKNGEKFARVSVSEGRGDGVSIFFYPYAPYSYEMVDND